MSVLPKIEAVIIELDEEDVTSMPPKKRFKIIPDESMISTANELLALSGKKPLRCFRPLSRTRNFYPSHHASKPRIDHTIAENKNGCLAAISDEEDDRNSDLFATSSETHTLNNLLNKPLLLRQPKVFSSSSILMGRPLSLPPRLPRLAPGQLVVLPPPPHMN